MCLHQEMPVVDRVFVRYVDYDPYERPVSSAGYIMDDQTLTSYGRPSGPYGRAYGGQEDSQDYYDYGRR